MKSSKILLGSNTLDPACRVLVDNQGKPIRLRYRSMSVLVALAEKPGEVVDRDWLVGKIWADANVSEDSLAQCIADIRKALGDAEKRVIETVPRKGYRLVQSMPVTSIYPRSRVAALLGVVITIAAGFGFLFWPDKDQSAPVVAVLPLDDLSTTEYAGYLNDALSEGIISELARFPQFSVIARNSSFQFREKPEDIRRVGKVLGADYVVEGSQQFDGFNVRISVRLLETGRGTLVFADKFDRDLDELLIVQDEIVRHVASIVGGSVLTDLPERRSGGRVNSLLRGLQARKLMSLPTLENWSKALALEETSIREDPDSPWGYIGKSLMLVNGSFQGWMDRPKEDVLREAAGLAQKAMAIAPDNYMSHYAAARVISSQKAYGDSLLHFERAAELNPSDSLVTIAMSLPLLFTGQTERAITELLRAKAVDPLHGDWLSWQLGWAYWQNRQCKDGLDVMLGMANPPVVSLTMLSALYVCAGEENKASETMAVFLEARPGYSLLDETKLNPTDWKPEGTLERWLSAMQTAGMPD